jgi:hypothetical protein
MNAVDQWDRPWLLSIELATGDPTGLILPAGWDDPLRTPQEYITVPKNRFNQPSWGRVHVDYPPWIRKVAQDQKDWRMQFLNTAQQQFKGKFKTDEIWDDPYIQELVGPKPYPSVELLERARTGDREVLGIVPVTSPEVLALFGAQPPKGKTIREMTEALERELSQGSTVDEVIPFVTGTSRQDYTTFMAQAKDAGMTQAAANLAWREHKENIEALVAEQEGEG